VFFYYFISSVLWWLVAKMLQCHIRKCTYKASSKHEIEKHTLFHKKIFNCDTCRKTFTTSSDLRRHERTHSLEAQFQCSFENCSFTTKRSDTLKLHEKTHTSIESRLKYPCPSCGKLFSSQQIITRHLKRCDQMLKNKDLECKVCFKVFSNRSKLKIHIKNHEGKLDFACHVCDRKFATNYALNKHLMVHEKSFECQHCKKMFARKDNLDSHIKRNHEVNNIILDYICSYCQKTFNSSDELMSHFVASTVCNEGCQEQNLYQEEVASDSVFTTDLTTALTETNHSYSETNVLLVRNVLNQDLILLEQPILIFKQ